MFHDGTGPLRGPLLATDSAHEPNHLRKGIKAALFTASSVLSLFRLLVVVLFSLVYCSFMRYYKNLYGCHSGEN